MTTATGWVALAGRLVGTVESCETVYTWDHRFHTTKAAAVKAGFPLAGGTDDFNIGKVENGRLVWFGWMDKKHPEEDYAEVAAQFGWTAPDPAPARIPRPRGFCPDCGYEYAVKLDGTLRSHRRRYANGYCRGAQCPGTDHEPDALQEIAP